jgi:hypothetical protein
VSPAGLERVLHGNAIRPEHIDAGAVPGLDSTDPVRLLAPDGRLVALARERAGALHPVVVLG